MNSRRSRFDEGVAVPFDGTDRRPGGTRSPTTWSFGDGGTATGVAPIYTYRSVKTFTVTLTVNDGFGGISTATATITVNDVPPAFVPARSRRRSPSRRPPGDGFGAAVASVAGDAAIGARSRPSHTGAVLSMACPPTTGIATYYSAN